VTWFPRRAWLRWQQRHPLNSHLSSRLVPLSVLFLLATACRDPAPPPAPVAQAAPPRVSPDTQGTPFDLGEVVRRVHFAYRPDGEGWTAGHGTWSARATSEELTLTPRHALEEMLDPSLEARRPERGSAPHVLQGTPVTFGTAVLSRGGSQLNSPAARGAVSPEGSLAWSRGELEEELHNSEDGVEQRLRFGREPQGQGALTLRVPVKGLPFAGETPRGVHFADEAGLGVRYGDASWTDASGKRTELRVRSQQGEVELQVPAELLAGSTFPATLAVGVSPEFGLDMPVTNPGGGRQTEPAVATDGTDFLVVWTDDRNGGSTDLYGTIVSATGLVLNPLGIAISTAVNQQENPAVAFDGTNYLVVWEDGRRASGVDIYGARVSPTGTVQDPNGLVIANSTAFNERMDNPAIAFDGTNYLVAWDQKSGYTGPTNLYAQRVSKAGTRLTTITISSTIGDQSNPALAFDGTNYLAAWEDSRNTGVPNIYAARISKAGTVLDPSGLMVGNHTEPQYAPTVAFNGTNHLLAWTDRRNGHYDIYGARVSPSGSVLDPAGRPLIQTASDQMGPQLIRQGTEYLMTWYDYRPGNFDIYAARVSAAGTSLDGLGFVVLTAPAPQLTPVVASNGTRHLIAWQDNRYYDIGGARVDSPNTVLDLGGFTISTAPNSQRTPAMAFDGANYLIVWQDNRGGTSDIYGVRVSASGTVLDPTGFIISSGWWTEQNPSLAFDGTNYLVVWEDSRVSYIDIYGARVSPNGTVLDPNGIRICDRSSFQESPRAAFDGTNYLVVWQSGDNFYNLLGTRISRAGVVLDPGFLTISSGTQSRFEPAIAFDGTNYLVTWSDFRSGQYLDIYGTRVSRAGVALDPNSIPIAVDAEGQSQSALAFDGTNYLVTWMDFQGASVNISGRRVSPSGTVLDAAVIPIAPGVGAQETPAVTYNGTDFLVVWQDLRSTTSRDIYGGRVTRAGVPRDGDGFAISTGSMNELTPVVASSGGGNSLVVYQMQDPALGHNTQRLKARRINQNNNPPTADAKSVTTQEDVTASVVLSGSDPDNDALTYAIATAPAHGTLAGTAPNLTYTPAPDYHGPDSFTFTVSDGVLTSAPATVTVTVTPVDDVPVASAQTLETEEDTPKSLTLTGSDAEGDTLSFTVASGPSHGTLAGTAPDLTYTPAPDYHGPDSFTFTVSDGQNTSTPATVSITVTAGNDGPIALAQSLTTAEDTALPLVLSGSDVDGDPLAFTLASSPAHGTLTGTAPNLTYTPAADYHGPDSFTFTVTDGQLISAVATVSISVTSRNDAPVATAGALTVDEDVPTPVTLSGSDVDGDPLTFTIASPPTRGTLTGSAPNLTYRPAADYHGPDSFTFTVSDGQATSAPATVSISVTARNDAPVARAQSVTLNEGTTATITLSGSDADGDRLSFAVASAPTHGTLSGTAPNLTYTPVADYHGPDSFTFTVSDGQATSAVATVSITVVSLNDAPVANPLALSTREDTPVPVVLSGTDADGDTLSFTVASNPSHGTLTGTTPNLTYTPAAGYHGPDSFTFTVSDGEDTSAPATVSLMISPVNDAPVAMAQTLTTTEDTSLSLTLSGTDEEGASLAFTVSAYPAHGTLLGTAPNLTYAPAPDYHGPDSFTFTVSDGQRTSALATVSLSVSPSNDAPVPRARSITLDEDTPTALTLSGSDVDGDALSFTVTGQPLHGALTGTAPDLTYTPAPGYHGPDSFTFTVSDGQTTSARATIALTIVSRNDAPVADAQTLTVPAGHPTPIYLEGHDEDGDALSFAIVTGPDVGKLTGTPPDVLYTAPPSYRGPARFTFSVSDGTTASQAEVQLTVVKKALRVSAAVDARRLAEGQTVRFYANAVDEAGAPISLEWNFGDGHISREALPLHGFTQAGTYEVRLKATTATEEATTSLRIRVRSIPVIDLAPNARHAAPLIGEEGSAILFHADTARPGVNYTWDFGDGSPTMTGTTAANTWADDGRFTLKVTAADAGGNSWVVTRAITILNAPPVPLPQAVLTARVGEPVTVQLAASDAAGSMDSLQWELLSGEGALAADGTFHWTPTQEGLATVVATVHDGDGGEAPLAFQIAVDRNIITEPDPSTGCGCGAASGDASSALGLGLLLALLAFSRRLIG
jgi:hypothetical protein